MSFVFFSFEGGRPREVRAGEAPPLGVSESFLFESLGRGEPSEAYRPVSHGVFLPEHQLCGHDQVG